MKYKTTQSCEPRDCACISCVCLRVCKEVYLHYSTQIRKDK
nr:MAG TPA: hypothetical protein [Caudoviricetes sp.]